jgi:hypothetical protein
VECNEQRQADPGAIVERKENLRARVARLESFMNLLMREKSIESVQLNGQFGLDQVTTLAKPGTYITSNHTSEPKNPYILHNDVAASSIKSFLSDQERGEAGSSSGYSFTVNPLDQISSSLRPSLTESKQEATRNALLAMLPPTQELMKVLRHEKPPHPALEKPSLEPEALAAQTISRGSPIDVATLLVRSALQLDENKLNEGLSTAEHLIIGDETFMSTLAGLEFAVYLALAYSDTGQMHKAWTVIRRGLLGAQMIGINKRRQDLSQDTIWWGLYLTDRLYSLILGLSYGIPDNHCNLTYDGHEAPENRSLVNARVFLVSLSQIICKVIDLIQDTNALTVSSVLRIDRQLTDLSRKMSNEFWDINTSGSETPEHYGQVIGQLTYHYARVTLHMRFMFKSPYSSDSEYSCNICVHSAREFLNLYHLKRYPEDKGHQSKTLDSAGYTASVLVALRLLGYGTTGSLEEDQQQLAADWRLVNRSMDIFIRTAKQGGLSQGWYQALRELSLLRNAASSTVGTTIVIPYFGAVTIRRSQKSQPIPTPDASYVGSQPVTDLAGQPPILPPMSSLLQEASAVSHDTFGTEYQHLHPASLHSFVSDNELDPYITQWNNNANDTSIHPSMPP